MVAGVGGFVGIYGLFNDIIGSLSGETLVVLGVFLRELEQIL